MKLKTKRNLFTVFLSIMCAVLLYCSVGLLGGTNNKIATAAAPTTSETVIQLTLDSTNLAPAEVGGKMFSGEGLAKLYDAILGTGYNNAGTYNKVKRALTNADGTSTQTWSSINSTATAIVPNAITANDIRNNSGSNVHVKIGKTAFEVVYVTLDNSGDIIVDLWQSESTQISPYSADASGAPGYSIFNGRNNSPSTRPSNVYGNSYIRAKMLGQGGSWDAFTGESSASTPQSAATAGASTSSTYADLWNDMTIGKLSAFIDTPSQVKYQEIESNYAFENKVWLKFSLPGDAYGIPFDEHYHVNNLNANVDTGYGGNGTNLITGQDQWKNDKIWLPSLAETGYDSRASIWELDNNQRKNTDGSNVTSSWDDGTDNISLLRSGEAQIQYNSISLQSSGGLTALRWTSCSLAVRPALHLNLKKAQENSSSDYTAVPVPQNITVDYDGNAKWLDTLETMTDTSGDYKFKWIDTTLHNNTSIVTLKKIEYTDYDALGVQVTANKDVTSSGTANILNAGKYEVTLEIPSTSTDYAWRGGGTGEKKFTITINQISVPYTLQIKKGSTVVTSLTYGDTFTDNFVQTAVTTLPTDIYELQYAGTGTTVYAASLTAPTDAGTYSLSVKAKADPANAGKNMPSNYKLTGSPASFTIDKKKLDVPTITNPQSYTGSELTFVLADFNSGTYISMDGVAAANGSTATGAGGAATTDTTDTFEATKVDVYTVTLSLRDTTNYVWSDNTNTAKTVDFEITQKELLSTAPVSSAVNGIGNAEWEFGDSTVTVTVTDDRISGETINLLCYYDVVGGTSKSNTLTATTTGNVTVITMPNDIPVGSYTLTVELNGTTGDNANYKVTAYNTLDFEITSGRIDPSTYGWIYTKDGVAGSTIKNGDKLPFELKAGSTVDGVKYEVSIQIPAAHTSVVVDTSKYAGGYQLRSGNSVGTYATKVALKSTDPTFEFEDASGNKTATIEVTLNWEIEQGTFDLSNVKWEYSLDGSSWADYDSSNPPQYNDGNYITVRVKASTLPLGLTLDSLYTGSDEYDVDNYTATISASDLVYNTTNFKAPDTTLLDLSWEIAKKNLFTGFKNVMNTYSNSNGSGTIIIKQLNVDSAYDSYITYKYYDLATGLEVTLADIKAAADPTNEKKYKVEAYVDPAFAANFSVEASDGSTPSDTFVTGSKNKLATVTIDGNDGTTPITAVYDGNNHFDSSLIVVTGDDGINVTDFTVTYYTGTTPTAGNELPAGELPKDAGKYCVAVTLGAIAEKKYILATDWFTLTVEPKGIEVPTLSEMTFNGNELKIEDYLGGTWNDYKSIIELGGKLADRNVGAGDYATTLKLTDTNYKWIYPTATPAPTKLLLAYKATADGASVTGDDTVATYNWNISPLIVDTTNMWNKGSKGATLKLPQNIKDLIAGGTLEVGYRYYDSEGNYLETPEIKGGKSFKVEAVFAGDDAVRNVQFKTGDNSFGATSKGVDYTVPQSGAAAFFGKALSFLKNNWWWLLIALAVLIFLIILIVVLVKRSKNKEEREEKKRLKEEERQRREEEREAERRRREQELELEKAKREAELAKMKAELGLGAAAAGVAVAAQQPQPQPQPVQQPQYSPNDLAEIKAQLAEIRAQQRMNNGYPQMPMMQMPMAQMPMMQMPMQMQMPSYGPQMAGGGMVGGNGGMMSDSEMRARIAEDRLFRSAEQRAIVAEERLRGGAPQNQPAATAPAQVQVTTPAPKADGKISAEQLGVIMAAMMNNMNTVKTTEERTVIETETAEAPKAYPPDTVITTTTTVDTTKPKAATPHSDDGRLFDVDGFYDTFDGNK